MAWEGLSLRKVQRTAFYAPTANRSYLTRKGAAHAEASALIRKKYPTEKPGWQDGPYATGWHWHQDERLCRLHTKLFNIIMKVSR